MSRGSESRQKGSLKGSFKGPAACNSIHDYDSIHVYDSDTSSPYGSEEDSLDYFDSKLYKDLHPILNCMRIFGVYFARRKVGTRTITERHVVWCYIFFIICVLNFLRSLTVYTPSDGEKWNHALNQKLLCTIWSAECVVKVFVLLYYCYRDYGLPKFFRTWKVVCNDSGLGTHSNQFMWKLIAVACMFIIFNSVVFSLILIYIPKLETLFLEVGWRNALKYENLLLFKVLLGGLAIINSSSSMFPMAFYVVILFGVARQFQRYNDKFSSAILKDGTFDGDLEEYRLRHQKLCSLVHILDRIFSPMIAAMYGANIPMFCFVMYTIFATVNLHISLLLINIFWLSFILFQIALISGSAAWLNAQAHGALESIYTIRSTNGPSDLQLQLSMFLSRLTGTKLGLTALRMFVVDRAAILMVLGMMITHFLLLVELKPTDHPLACNCSLPATISIANNTYMLV